MSCSKKYTGRTRTNFGQSKTRKPSKKLRASERKQRGKTSMTRREYGY